MISTMLLFALGGYLGVPSVYQPIGDGSGRPDPNGEPKKWPWWWPRPPIWWYIAVGVCGGLGGGYAVNTGFAENPVLALGGAIIGGRLAYDVVNALRNSTAKTL